jgi:hypothetical protein
MIYCLYVINIPSIEKTEGVKQKIMDIYEF